MPPPSSSQVFKVVLLGEGRVGKTSLISRYVHDTFDSNEQSTVQSCMYSTKTVPIDESLLAGASGSSGSRTVQLALWDTAGQERYHALAPIYYRNADAAMLVYDVCDADSLQRVRTWVKELRAVTGDRIQLVLCGNKCDRAASEQEVSSTAGMEVAAELGALHYHTSAKTGESVAAAFSAVATLIVRERLLQVQSQRGNGTTGRRGLRILDEGDAGLASGDQGARDRQLPTDSVDDYTAAVMMPPRRTHRRTVALDDDTADSADRPLNTQGATAAGGCC